MSSTFDQYRRELESLRFSDDALARMTARLENASEHAGNVGGATDVNAVASPRAAAQSPAARTATGSIRRPARTRPARHVLRIAASVAIAMGLGLGATGAYAAATQRSLTAVFSDIFGGAPAQTEIIDKIGHPIGASATSNGVTVTADAVIGSSNSCTVVFSVSRDDGRPFQDLEPAADGTHPLLWAAADIQIDGLQGLGSGSYFYDADPTDNSIQYVYTINNATTSDGNGLSGRTARVHLSDLSRAAEQANNTEAIATGSWDLKFQLDYEDSAVTLPAGQRLELNSMSATVNKLSVSPVGASVTYTVDAVSAESENPEELPSDKFVHLPFAVTFKDGHVADGTNADASTRERNGCTIVTKSFVFDAITSVDDIASVTVGDQVILIE